MAADAVCETLDMRLHHAHQRLRYQIARSWRGRLDALLSGWVRKRRDNVTTPSAEQLAKRRLAMLAVVPIGLLLLDARGAIAEANPAAPRVLGLSAGPRSLDELHGRVLDPVTGGTVEVECLPWRRALRGERVDDVDLLLIVPPHAERRMLTVSATPFHDPGAAAPGALVVIIDRVRVLLRESAL
jgi:PAS domain-containing protein